MRKNDSKVNVLHLRDSPWVDGPGRTIIETASVIDKERYNYFIGAFARINGEKNPLIEAAIKKELNAFPIKESSRFDINVFRQILDYIDKNDVHLIHTHEFRSDLIGIVCAKIKKIPAVTTLHGWIPNGLKGKFFVSLDKLTLHFFDKVIVVSEKLKQQTIRLMIPEKKVSVIHNAILVDQYQPDHKDYDFKRELGLDNETVLVGNIGRLSPEKGQSDFIMAAQDVLKHYKNIKFLIIGTGPDRQRLEKLVWDFQVHQSVLFTGFRKDMQKIYNSLDLVVQSSYTEGMPNVILEALLMEVPVVATDVGGTSEIIKNNITGVLITPKSSDDITRRTMEFLSEPDRFKLMANTGRSLVRKQFNFYDRTKKLTMVYEEVMQTRGSN